MEVNSITISTQLRGFRNMETVVINWEILKHFVNFLKFVLKQQKYIKDSH